MGWDKVITKSILTSLAAIGVLLVFVVGALCAFFPSTTMMLAYDLGMDATCIHMAERVYKDNGEIYFIAYATEVAIEEDNENKIISCGEKMIADKNFDKYCQEKGGNYASFIYGKIGVAKYEKGDKEGAVSFAYTSLNGGFPEDNAVVAVYFAAKKINDTETMENIKTRLSQLQVSGAEKNYLDSFSSFIG